MAIAIPMPLPRRPGRRLRVVLLVAAVIWLIAGGLGLFRYVDRYYLYRGFPPPTTPHGVATGAVVHASLASAALGKRRGYLVYLPPGYRREAAAGRRFPVLYLLHGRPGLADNLIKAGRVAVDANVLLHRHAIRPMIVVIPGGPQWADTEWADAGAGRYESFLLELVRDVDRRFATLADRRHRVLAGLSEGGYGAINVALRHLGTFGGVQSWSGYYVAPHAGAFAHASAAELAANSPAAYVDRLAPEIRRLGLRAYLYAGNETPRDDVALRVFAARLRAAGARVGWGIFRGGHDWALWRAQMPHMLRLASAWFAHRPAGARARRLS